MKMVFCLYWVSSAWFRGKCYSELHVIGLSTSAIFDSGTGACSSFNSSSVYVSWSSVFKSDVVTINRESITGFYSNQFKS